MNKFISTSKERSKIIHIFISHIREEAIIAEAIRKRLLERVGDRVRIFMGEDIPLGKNWFEEIKMALNEADVIIAVFSPNSLERPWINIEVGYGVMSGKKVIPVCCSGLSIQNLPVVYAMNQAIKIDTGDDIDLLIRNL